MIIEQASGQSMVQAVVALFIFSFIVCNLSSEKNLVKNGVARHQTGGSGFSLLLMVH
jgi:hypothetical protein